MIIGVPKELPPIKGGLECRVASSPWGVRELIAAGADVYVESTAGKVVGFSDENYVAAGAKIAYSREEAYKRVDVLLKVRVPHKEEWEYLREGQILFGFLHLATAPKELIQTFIERKITAIGHEIIQEPDGHLPILKPISEIAGKMAPQIAARLLETASGGRGILLGGISGIPPAEVVILGAGTLGSHAAESFLGTGASVYVVDRNREKLERLQHQLGHRIVTLLMNKYNLEKLVKFANVLICAVLVPGERTPVVITKEMVSSMKEGSVIIDFSIDQGGCCETSRLTPLKDFVFKADGVTHFCMPNSTTLVARTASHAITGSSLPFIVKVITLGIEKALDEVPSLRKGTYIHKGVILHKYLKDLYTKHELV